MEKLFDALTAIVDYMWEDEITDWKECGKPDNHIFIHVRTVARFMSKIYRYTDTHGWFNDLEDV